MSPTLLSLAVPLTDSFFRRYFADKWRVHPLSILRLVVVGIFSISNCLLFIFLLSLPVVPIVVPFRAMWALEIGASHLVFHMGKLFHLNHTFDGSQ